MIYRSLIKRIIDIFFSILGIIFLLPLFLLIAFLIKINDNGPIFFLQERVGLNGTIFKIIKFRTMSVESERSGLQLTVKNDNRITKIGKILRKYKLDEFPQLINVLYGDMSLVGPRPEIQKYVKLYNKKQKLVLTVRPGITDIASIKFKNENELLDGTENPEIKYINYIMPKKLRYNLWYIKNYNFCNDIYIIFLTLKSVFIK